MTQNNYNWITPNLQTIYADLDITLTGLIGVCTTSSGLTIYALDCSGYVLIIKNTGSISVPSFVYTYLQISDSPFTEIDSILYNNFICCSADGTYILVAYPTGTYPFIYIIYILSNNDTMITITQITSLPTITSPTVGISGNGKILGILANNQLYLSDNSGTSVTTVLQPTISFSFSYTGDWIYLCYSTLYVYDFILKTLTSIYTFSNNAFQTQQYIDVSGQYLAVITELSDTDTLINYSSNYGEVFSAVSSDQLTQINSTNNSLGQYLITSNYGVVYTTKSGIGGLATETFFTGMDPVYCVATNYCDSDNQPMAVCIGATNDSTVLNFYYGYSNPIASSDST